MAETKHLIPGLFWRLLGFKGGSIDIIEKGITLHKSDKSYFIDNHTFVKKGFQLNHRLLHFGLQLDLLKLNKEM